MVSQAKTDFSVGDLVEARKGERVIRDRIYAGPYEFRYLGEPSVFGPSSVGWFRDQGFTLSLVEAATPPLPSETGALGWFNTGYMAALVEVERRIAGAKAETDKWHEAAESKLEAVRKYAEDRSHYGKQKRTVHLSRIASDLFQILAVEREGEKP